MIAFGTAISDHGEYERFALPGIERAAEPDSLVLTCSGRPIRHAYNQLMDEAAARPDLEALVLVHQDLELTDGSLPRRLRRLFGDPAVGLAGALGVRDIELHIWLGSRNLFGTVAAPGLERRFSAGTQRVDAVDGALLALAPWVVRGLRFGTAGAPEFHGYDMELSLYVSTRGGAVLCDDIPYFHHRGQKADFEAQRFAGMTLAARWDPALRPRAWDSAFELWAPVG